jgi:hypothetical protein
MPDRRPTAVCTRGSFLSAVLQTDFTFARTIQGRLQPLLSPAEDDAA